LRQELAEALVRERDRLRRTVHLLAAAERALSESQGAESDAGGADADVASDLAEEEVTLVLERAERERLAEVEAALQRIAADSYGHCERCGKRVETRRLYARPWARTCLACAQQVEARWPTAKSRN
jgi:RNA polymerase-binding transcription factor DksA